ncbi:UDP-galactose transporter, partial [Ostertagia ostertagi]
MHHRLVTHMGANDDSAKEVLLPISMSSENLSKGENDRRDILFKAYVVITMTWLWTGYTLTVRYTRTAVPKDELYASSTVVLMAEVVKAVLSLIMLFIESRYKFQDFAMCIQKYYLDAPRELFKMSVPSVAYALQNNLDFIALSHLDAGLYQVTTQLKVFTTAIFMMLFLGRKFSRTRWAAILLLFFGVAAVQLNNAHDTNQEKKGNYLIGISAVLATCITAGFAGVYFEMMLKGSGTTRSGLTQSSRCTVTTVHCGVFYSTANVSALIGCLFSEGDLIIERGFFYGYDIKVCAIVGFLSFGGTYISLVMKYLDNLHKSFASAVSIILVVIT